ncbi:hypothetical protein CTheo_3142 [Ceratobasidium theobromae]|uniref:Dipeptidase n=1 Tax=Ceratobasidium theobromae TaxID=1582974 RepID=A0A5N5QNY8_9AGAM|nr:hypothetical protein CTheo_3142 [Ceratobasidium theobromae]
MSRSNERAPLLVAASTHSSHSDVANRTHNEGGGEQDEYTSRFNPRLAVSSILALVVSLSLIGLGVFYIERLPDDANRAAIKILERAPVIDGHIDLPLMVREVYRNNITKFNMRERMELQVDIPRLRAGKVGGFFWSVYVDCADAGTDFTRPTNEVRCVFHSVVLQLAQQELHRDTLEQIDVSKLLIEEYSDTFMLTTTVKEVEQAMRMGRIASFIGVEGGHQIGNSLAVLRQYYALGARYMTLTHSCNNAFADSAGIFERIPAAHGGLSSLGQELIREMNRLGMLVDLSHTSDETAIQALKLSRAPVMWSHSSARAVHNVPRNVPDNILKMIGTGPGQKDGVVMINLFPRFLGPEGSKVTVLTAADHIEHIGRVAGREHVGIGSDFDGIEVAPEGLEDVSKYPALFAELLRRGWSRVELEGLASKNLLRVFRGAEDVAREMQKSTKASLVLYDKRDPL